MANVIAPQAGLRLEVQFLRQSVVQIFLFAVHERGQPQAGLGIGAPAVEVEVPACVPFPPYAPLKRTMWNSWSSTQMRPRKRPLPAPACGETSKTRQRTSPRNSRRTYSNL